MLVVRVRGGVCFVWSVDVGVLQCSKLIPFVLGCPWLLSAKVPEHVTYDDFWTRYFFRAERVASGKTDGGMSFPPDGKRERSRECVRACVRACVRCVLCVVCLLRGTVVE